MLDTVTWAKIAEALSLSVHTVKKWGTGSRRRFNPRNFVDVVRFCVEYRK